MRTLEESQAEFRRAWLELRGDLLVALRPVLLVAVRILLWLERKLPGGSR